MLSAKYALIVCFLYFSTQTYVVGTQKNCLNETERVLLSTQNACLNGWIRLEFRESDMSPGQTRRICVSNLYPRQRVILEKLIKNKT